MSTATSHTCPKCKRGFATGSALRKHKCKASTQGKLSLVGESTGPDWTRARNILEGIKHAFRLSLAGQILLGHELLTLKTELGFLGSGGDRRSKRNDFALKSLNRTWEDWCKSELGLSDRGADNIITAYEAAKSKLKKLGGQPKLLGLMETHPAKLDEEGRKILHEMVARITWGDSQKALLEEFRLMKRHEALTGGDTSDKKPQKDPKAAAEQLAFAFFLPVPTTVAKLEKTITNLRVSPDYKSYLYTLPLTSSEPGQLSLAALEATIESVLSGDLPKALEEIRAAMKARIKEAS